MKKNTSIPKRLSLEERTVLFTTLKTRFEKNPKRHKGIVWSSVEAKLKKNQKKLWSLAQMEETGGEPDVVLYNKKTDEFVFVDCSEESPKGRRSYCYDQQARASRKQNAPGNSALAVAEDMGVSLLSEAEYRSLQKLGTFDTKTSSWIETPIQIRKLGGALFADFRYGTVFVYHNGAESYYAARGFRCSLRV